MGTLDGTEDGEPVTIYTILGDEWKRDPSVTEVKSAGSSEIRYVRNEPEVTA